MMKKILFKVNIAMILVMILFANTSFAAVNDEAMLSDILEKAIYGDIEARTGEQGMDMNFNPSANTDEWKANVPYIVIKNSDLSQIGEKYGGTITINGGSIEYISNDTSEKKSFQISLGGSDSSASKEADSNTYGQFGRNLDIQTKFQNAFLQDTGESFNAREYNVVTFADATYTSLESSIIDGENDTWNDDVSFSKRGNISVVTITDESGTMINTTQVKVATDTGKASSVSHQIGNSTYTTEEEENLPIVTVAKGESTQIEIQTNEETAESVDGGKFEKYNDYYFTVGENGYFDWSLVDEDGNMVYDNFNIINIFDENGNWIASSEYEGTKIYGLEAGKRYFVRVPADGRNYQLNLKRHVVDDTVISQEGADDILKSMLPDEPEWYEKVISWFIRLVGQGLQAIVSIVVGQPLSIDKLVFDRFPMTSLLFFKNDAGNKYYNSMIGNAITNDTDGGLDYIFNLFRRIAILAYMIMLVYMGLRILIMTANAGKKAKYKELIFDWVKGIVILFFFPYVIRYTILLNHAFVTYLYEKVGNDSRITGAEIKSAGNFLADINGYTVDDGSESVDYMVQMYRTANRSKRISDAICWFIMVVQVVQFLIVYMKRLITIIFLIAIFPLVTISYAIDKIGDGKSQAFNNWYKEFALQVFIQSFHAVNYVIVMSIILGAEANWVLKIIGIGYVAKGGDILRGLFAQMKGGAGGDGGPLEVAKAYVKTRLAIEGVSTISKSVTGLFGANSMLGKGINRIQDSREGLSYKSALKAERNANKTVRLNLARENASKAKEDVKNLFRSEEDLNKEKEDLERTKRFHQMDLSEATSEEERQRLEREIAEIDEKLRNHPNLVRDSLDRLAKLSPEELQQAMDSQGISDEDKEKIKGALNHAGAVGILLNSRRERNIDVRTAVHVVLTERKERITRIASGTTDNELLDKYIELTQRDARLSEEKLRKINAAHSITIDDAAASANAASRTPVPTDTEGRVEYALGMMKNAVEGYYGVKELKENTDFLDSVKSDARYATMIQEAEEEAGFSYEDFKLNLAAQIINDSNRVENVGNAEAQVMIDDAIDDLKGADRNANREILAGVNANVDELEKGYLPQLRAKEEERSKLQRELSRTMRQEDMLGRYGEDWEQYLDERIDEVGGASTKNLVRGFGGTVFGAAGGAAKTAVGIGSAAVSTGATYSGGQSDTSVITGVAGTLGTVDTVSKKIGSVGERIVDYAEGVVTPSTSPVRLTKSSVDINRNGHFRDSAIKGAADEEMRRRENTRNWMLNRRGRR